MGLVHQVVPPDALDEAVRSYALTVAKNAPSAIALTKSLLAAQHGMSLEAGLDYAAGMNALARGTEDTKRGIAAFLRKK